MIAVIGILGLAIAWMLLPPPPPNNSGLAPA
jgi:hypothetical protein